MSVTMALGFHHFLKELQESGFIAGSGGKGFQNLALMIHSPPQIMLLAVDLHKHLVEVPPPNGYRPAVNALTSDFSGEHRPEPVPQEAHGLVADVDPALGQQILDVPQRQGIFDIHHYDEADHLRRAVEMAKRALRLSSGFAAYPRRLPLLGIPCHIRLTVPFVLTSV